MLRNTFLAFLAVMGLSTVARADELDRERPGTAAATATAVAAGDALAATRGSEMDGESPAQANYRYGPRFGGFSINVGYRNYGYGDGGFNAFQPAYYGGYNQGFYRAGYFAPAYAPAYYGGFNQPYYGGYRNFYGGGWGGYNSYRPFYRW